MIPYTCTVRITHMYGTSTWYHMYAYQHTRCTVTCYNLPVGTSKWHRAQQSSVTSSSSCVGREEVWLFSFPKPYTFFRLVCLDYICQGLGWKSIRAVQPNAQLPLLQGEGTKKIWNRKQKIMFQSFNHREDLKMANTLENTKFRL